MLLIDSGTELGHMHLKDFTL